VVVVVDVSPPRQIVGLRHVSFKNDAALDVLVVAITLGTTVAAVTVQIGS
jgi:hypothetical protein